MKKALITGASEGLGKEFAIQLAKNGYEVTAIARNETKLSQLIREIGNNSTYIVADLSLKDGLNKIIHEIENSRFDLLINNAGIGAMGDFIDLSEAKLDEILSLNIHAVVNLSHTYLKKAKSGDALINVSSSLAFMPMPLVGFYAATKAFVTSFSESLWYEQKSRGVYVMALCPGIMTTNFVDHSGGGMGKPPKAMTKTPEQVAKATLKSLKSRNKPAVLTHFTDKLFAFIFRLYSRKAIVSTMGKMGSKP
jgi:short-subunit dehydrogenase